ncbi:hydrolase [Persicitalea jodogahamensis]|uniref:Hydrolase n=1 Tax=Persicitalea jodogahamensis TaxID=402147 RepID=A0A8J3D4G1_9BACT|nr:hydrolase [Persicitalea jodogahamensis]
MAVAVPLAAQAAPLDFFRNFAVETTSVTLPDPTKSIIGQYGSWAAGLRPSPPQLSLRANRSKSLDAWRKEALAKVNELVASPPVHSVPKVTVEKKYVFDGLEIEELSWQLPHGRPTKAVFLKPAGVKNPLPAVLGLHDHGGNKYFGWDKIAVTSETPNPLMTRHREQYYEGRAWANELAKSGYAVLVHDVFTFGSRRVHYEDVDGITWGPNYAKEKKSDAQISTPEEIAAYNAWASDHEHIMSKSLFCAGTTWPGVTLAEDQMALTILSQRPEVDPNRLGCMGLSGGGLRTVYLGGLDQRVKCAVPVGFMTTWSDLLLNKAYTHTWMIYTPLLSNYLEFSEIMGLRTPRPTLVLSNREDQLFTLPEMQKSDEILKEVYKIAKASDAYKTSFYDGPHKFDKAMQEEAFGWLDRWLV